MTLSFTYQQPQLLFNPIREQAFRALQQVLQNTVGQEDIREVDLHQQWFTAMDQCEDLFADGWYSPPPKGIAVLFGERLHFDSLRNEAFWSGERIMDWARDSFYAYASPVGRKNGMLGDLSVTLYFGEDQAIRDHIYRCHEATLEVFHALTQVQTPAQLLARAQEIFSDFGLASNVISRTDAAPTNLGHTFPFTDVSEESEALSDEAKKTISQARRFLNEQAQWSFEPGLQFTIEPQLIDPRHPELPKVTQHYVVQATQEGFIVCNDIDELLEQYQLI